MLNINLMEPLERFAAECQLCFHCDLLFLISLISKTVHGEPEEKKTTDSGLVMCSFNS